MAAVVFDIGETLICYGNPLSWQTLYRPALERADRACGLGLSEEDFSGAAEVLRRYNTRLCPRIREVCADDIFQEILDVWRRPDGPRERVKREFFAFFKQNDPHPLS